MPVLPLFALLALTGQGRGPAPRFELAAPLATIPGVMIDGFSTGYGLAQETARARNLQARIMWIDATANIDRYNSPEKIVALCRQIKVAGFNTVVFDIKPISGQTIYKSRFAPKLTEWRGKQLPAEFDPLPNMAHECHANGLTIYASLNAFSEGHRIFKVGPGYARPEQQTVLYETRPILRVDGITVPLSPTMNAGDPGTATVFATADRLPADGDGAGIVLRRDQTVLEPFDLAQKSRPTLPIPRGSTIVYATGDAAAGIRAHSARGTRYKFDTEPLFVPISERPEQQIPLMMNPNHPDVQTYNLEIVREVVSNYNVDGIIYDDRLRYGGLNADFSETTRRAFEGSVKRTVNWPDDVFKFTINPNLTRGVQPGPLYDTWMSWRAIQIRDYVGRVTQLVRTLKPLARVGVYAGSWYGDYPAIGHNYASPDLKAGFWFLTPSYAKSGTAPLVDFLISGCYYPNATIYEAMSKGSGIGNCVEAAAALTNRVVRDQTWTYAGLQLSDYKDDPEGLQNALQAACASSQGVMVFDLSHDIEPMWPIFAKAFAQPRQAPDSVKGLLAEVRRRRKSVDALSVKEPPVIIAAGSAGTGQ